MVKYIIGVVALLLVGISTYEVLFEDDHGHGYDRGEEIVAKEPVRADGTFTLATSFYPLQFVLEKIVGDLGTVTNIGAGKDPHDFKPTTQSILTLQQADLVVLQGADFEPWGDDVMDQLSTEDVPVVLATADIKLHEGGQDDHDEDEDEDEEEHDEHGSYDPHTWLDPVLLGETVEHISEAIVTLDPENASTYETNASALQAELAALDAEYKNKLSNCALEEIITSHDAFGYVSERYGFEIHAIGGLSTQDVPSATVLAELKEEAEEGIEAILLEENSISAYGETLARETGLKTLSVDPIAYIVPNGDNYLTLMQANLNTFAQALKCNE